MIDLYYAATGNSFRAAVALEECGLEHRRHKVDLLKGEHKRPDFLALNPAGAVPVMIDTDGPEGATVTLSQSGAILLYAAERVGRFIPADPLVRIETLRWFMAAVTDAAPGSAIILYMGSFAPEPSEANQGFLEGRLMNVLRSFDGQIGDQDFVVGEISIADLALFPVVNQRRPLVERSGDCANLLRWADRMAARPAVQRALAF